MRSVSFDPIADIRPAQPEPEITMRVTPFPVVGAFAISACSASAQPTIATARASAPVLIGVLAFGSPIDLNRLEAFATQSGFPSKQMDAPEGRELVIAFPPGTSPSAVAIFSERLRGAEFSSLTFKSAYAPAPQ